jgi:hypothetical protein
MAEIGIVGPGPVYVIGAEGTVSQLGQRPVLDWWVGAEDRWHTASTEAAVRQTLGDDGSTIETRLKVPGGDVVQRVTVVPDGGRTVAVVEIENTTPVPIAVALVLDFEGSLSVFDDTLSVDGRAVVRASRSVARMFVATGDDALRVGVFDGAALPPSEAEQPTVGTRTALIFPLPHTAILRCAVALEGADRLPSPNDLPPTDAVARGWGTHMNSGASASFPDDRLLAVVGAARRHLLTGSAKAIGDPYWQHEVEPWVPALAATALDVWGHHIEARELLLAAVGSDDLATHARRGPDEAGALLWAWAERLERQPEPDLEAALTDWIQETAIGLMSHARGLFGRRRPASSEPWRAVGLASAGSVLSRNGNEALGPDIIDALPELAAENGSDPLALPMVLGGNRLGGSGSRSILAVLADLVGRDELSLGDVGALGASTGAVGLGGRDQHPLLSALILMAVGRAMVDEPEGTGGVVAVLSSPDPAWLGAPLEGHGFPVTGGSISFGARWHGDRPALLWDLERVGAGVGVSAPGLDPTWSRDEARGEDLLGVTKQLQSEAAPESPQVRRGEALDTTDDPDSFS